MKSNIFTSNLKSENSDLVTNDLSNLLFHGDIDPEPYAGSIHHGSVDTGDPLDGSVDMGDVSVDLEHGDLEAIQQGAPLKSVIQNKLVGKMGSRFGSAAAKKVTMANVNFPAFIAENATVVQYAAERKIPGKLLEWNLKRHRAMAPYLSFFATGSTPSSGVSTITWDSTGLSSLGEPAWVYTVPMVFVTISASQLNAKSGNRYQIATQGLSESLTPADGLPWLIERNHIHKPIRLTIIPFKRVKDEVRPLNCLVTTASDATTVGTVDGLTYTLKKPYIADIQQPAATSVGFKFKVKVSNLAATDETIVGTIPGLDSRELDAFCAMWKLNL